MKKKPKRFVLGVGRLSVHCFSVMIAKKVRGRYRYALSLPEVELDGKKGRLVFEVSE